MIELFKNIFSYGVLRIIAMFFSVIYVIVLAKTLSPENLGIYYLLITLLSFLMVLSRLGFDNLLVKNISIFKSKNNYVKIINLLSHSTYLIVFTSLFFYLIIFAFSDYISFYYLDSVINKNKLIIISLGLFFYNMSFIYSETFKALGNLNLSVIFPSILFPFFNIIGLFSLIDYFPENAIFISVFISLFFIYFFSRIILFDKLKLFFLLPLKFNFEFKNFNFPIEFYLIAISNFIFASVDTVVLGFFASNTEVGIYNILIRITLPFSTLLIIINNVYARDFSIWNDSKQFDKFYDVFFKLIKLSILFGLPYLLILVFFGNDILLFFGDYYKDYYAPLIILGLSFFLLLITGPSATILMMSGLELQYRKLLIYVGLLNILLSLILVPYFALFGAVISTSISIILKNIGSFYLAFKLLKNKTNV